MGRGWGLIGPNGNQHDLSDWTFSPNGSLEAPIVLTLTPSGATDDAIYTWSAPGLKFTEDTDKKLTATFQDGPVDPDANDISINTSKTYTITLSARDGDGNLLGEMTKGLTIVYGLPEITGIALWDPQNPGNYVTDYTFDIANSVLDLSQFAVRISSINGNAILANESNDSYTINFDYLSGYITDEPDCLPVCDSADGVIDNGYYYTPASTGFIEIITELASSPPGYTYNDDGGRPPAVQMTVEVIGGAVCGDGTVTGNEVCDDGNTANNDGCSERCGEEIGWACTGEPSVCEEPVTENACLGANGTWDSNASECLFGTEADCFNADGYWDGSGCWVLGAPGKACGQYEDPQNPGNFLPGACEDAGLSCVAGDWNDANWNNVDQIWEDNGCLICKELTGLSSCSYDDQVYSPYAVTDYRCSYRTTMVQSCSEEPQTLEGTIDTDKQRICKCQ